MVFLILTNSRTSWYSTAAMLTCAGFLACLNTPHGKNGIVRATLGLLAAAVIVLLCHWLRGEVFVLLDRAMTRQTGQEAAAVTETAASPAPAAYTLKALSATGGTETAEADAAEPAESTGGGSAASNARRYDDNLSTIGNRLPLYRAAIKAMFSSRYRFLFGVTPVNVVSLLRNYEGVSDTFEYDHAHNFFLQMGVSFGAPTMLAAIAFAVSLVIRCLRILLVGRGRVFPGAWMLCLMLLCFLANDMMEADLSGGMGIFCVTFYILAGWLLTVDRELRRKRKTEGR
jgi:O-antigen ligase